METKEDPPTTSSCYSKRILGSVDCHCCFTSSVKEGSHAALVLRVPPGAGSFIWDNWLGQIKIFQNFFFTWKIQLLFHTPQKLSTQIKMLTWILFPLHFCSSNWRASGRVFYSLLPDKILFWSDLHFVKWTCNKRYVRPETNEKYNRNRQFHAEAQISLTFLSICGDLCTRTWIHPWLEFVIWNKTFSQFPYYSIT